jgi:hypothetical protein
LAVATHHVILPGHSFIHPSITTVWQKNRSDPIHQVVVGVVHHSLSTIDQLSSAQQPTMMHDAIHNGNGLTAQEQGILRRRDYLWCTLHHTIQTPQIVIQ